MENIKYCQFDYRCNQCGRPINRQLQFVEGKPSVDLVSKWWCPNNLCNATYSLKYKATETARGNVHILVDTFHSADKKRKTKKMVLPVITS